MQEPSQNQNQNQTQNDNILTSTTAPGRTFTCRSELATHYKSDWHRYNLKRREANLPMLAERDFLARLEAARALRAEREGREERNGKDHLKKSRDGVGNTKKKNQKEKKKVGSKMGEVSNERVSKRNLRRKLRDGLIDAESTQSQQMEEEEESMEDNEEMDEKMETENQETDAVIDPCQSLFDTHICKTVDDNVKYMYDKYGFFLPDREYLVDLDGLIGYCAEKIKLGHYCLYCQKTFRTYSGCQKHMISSSHTKLRYETGIDMEEFDVFYDFTSANKEFLGEDHYSEEQEKLEEDDKDEWEDMEEGEDEDDEGEWEDVDSITDMDTDANANEESIYATYEKEIRTHGFDITPLGEIIFPDGRIIGHRGLSKYYKQRFAPERSQASVEAARKAGGERLYRGQVYHLGPSSSSPSSSGTSTLALAKAGLVAGAAPGRRGGGILVPLSGGGGANGGGRQGFTALSLYRYRAAERKARKEEFKGRKLQERTRLNMNKMDKKGNRLTNNVSVAHAPR